MLLSDTVSQRYRYNTQGKTPTEIQQELRQIGVKGFVVKVAGSRVTMKVEKENIRKNRECMRNGRSN
ncbi:hypothetical protein K4P21_09885 [Staphylococcus epidermidis]|jgi:hypothetical protein|uniref:Uncharacterized protein n=1 Tax=Staphylococcus phage HS15 TaxID=3056405 RepID=A0AA49X346_9VIRU|nr:MULTISPECIES: hypothetical protein [Bacillota]MDU1965514.1 hypothetical protein [Staphylococcus lugdunensis]WLJ26142.1 MAG: hypothetical protein [Staphylococcus phage HS15]KAB2215124.1 hypothetical protein F9B25_10800 [Staphylococcus epidermidis]MBM6132785.1 hypothetical protein [Staphylococcus epidermidis]MCG1374788.1 hypothetical protein [Staphylococcus epidermidis]